MADMVEKASGSMVNINPIGRCEQEEGSAPGIQFPKKIIRVQMVADLSRFRKRKRSEILVNDLLYTSTSMPDTYALALRISFMVTVFIILSEPRVEITQSNGPAQFPFPQRFDVSLEGSG